jgi:hypothetical protein
VKPSELLKHYIFLHNFGVEMGDFEPLMAILDDNAMLAFENPRIGEFEGIAMIRGIFRRQPPTMTIVIGEITETANTARADYALEEKPGDRQGYVMLDIEENKINKLFIGL